MLRLTSALPKRPLASSSSARNFSSSPSLNFAPSSSLNRQRVIILGSGWSGYELLNKIDRERYDVITVSPNSYFAFTPLLASAAVGTIDFNSALEPVRKAKFGRARYMQARASAIDIKRKKITCVPAVGAAQRKLQEEERNTSDKLIPATSYPGQQPFELQYDKLVIAVGAYSQTFGTPGVKEHAYFLKDIRDAANIRQRILECYELAAQPTVSDVERKGLLNFVIVGGGPTGVEFAGELHDFIRGDLHRAYPALRPFARISIYDVGKTILSSFDESLSKYATEKYNREGIDIKTEHHVTAVHEGHIDIKEEGKVPHGMVVWSTGLAPNSFVESITDLEHDEKTKSIIVDGEFRARNVDGTANEDVFVIGDCSSLKEKLPATAQVASQEAKWLAKILNAQVRNRDGPGPFAYNNAGAMSYLGGWTAVVDRSSATKGPQGELTGKAAWLAWRGAYWIQAMSVRNRISLVYHWFTTWLLGRRLTKF